MFITIVLIPILKGYAGRLRAVDLPGGRKIHQRPTPKVGGLAMAGGFLIPLFLWAEKEPFTLSMLIGAGIIVMFGFLDDIRDLDYRLKLTGQILAALVIVLWGQIRIDSLGSYFGKEITLIPLLSVPLTCLVIVGVTNAINLADGLDGLAGGISLLTFITIGFLSYQGGSSSTILFCVAIIGAIIGFLRFNTFPAEIFMGDAGSQLLGFLVVSLSIALTQTNAPLSPVLPLLLIGFPILDTLTVMVERIAEGGSPFVADTKHFHHRLMRLNLYHTEAVFSIYVLQAIIVSAAYLFRYYAEWFLLTLYILFSGLVLVAFAYTDTRGWTLKRVDLIDIAIKGRLKKLKDDFWLIRGLFRSLEIVVPAVLVLICLAPDSVPQQFALWCAVIGVFFVILWVTRKNWRSNIVRISLYAFLPYLLFIAESNPNPMLTGSTHRIFNLLFVLICLLAIMTLKFTRRQKGFKTTPLDFLILFIAVVVPSLPGTGLESYRLGLVAAKIISMLFCFEVLLGEYRGQSGLSAASVIGALLIVSVKGLV